MLLLPLGVSGLCPGVLTNPKQEPVPPSMQGM